MKNDIEDLIAIVKNEIELLQRILSPRHAMQNERQTLLEALKKELEFVEEGGYTNSYRPALIFEESPICLNYADPERRHPCRNCVLMKLVPQEQQGDRIPCRHIPLNPQGETLASLYRTATHRELNWQFHHWLRSKIADLDVRVGEISRLTLRTDTAVQVWRA